MAFSNGYIFGFAAAVCVVCSISVAGVSMSLREKQDINRERDLRSNILGALGLPGEGQPPLKGEGIDQAWDKLVEQRFVTPDGKAAGPELDQDGNGKLDNDDLKLAVVAARESGATPALLGVYVRKDNGQVAIPLTGVGLWGPLSGYLALDPKGREVTGATFFAPKETPGLGAEIMEPPFKGRWVGKAVTDKGGATKAIRVVKGQAENLCPGDVQHCVDGVSGATITSRGVDQMVGDALAWYDPFLSGLRGG